MIWRRRRPFQERLCPPSLQKMRGCRRREGVEAGARTVGGQWRERAAPAPNRARTGRPALAVSRRGRQLARRQKTCNLALLGTLAFVSPNGSRAEPWPVGARGRYGVPSSNLGEPRRRSRDEPVGVAGRPAPEARPIDQARRDRPPRSPADRSARLRPAGTADAQRQAPRVAGLRARVARARLAPAERGAARAHHPRAAAPSRRPRPRTSGRVALRTSGSRPAHLAEAGASAAGAT